MHACLLPRRKRPWPVRHAISPKGHHRTIVYHECEIGGLSLVTENAAEKIRRRNATDRRGQRYVHAWRSADGPRLREGSGRRPSARARDLTVAFFSPLEKFAVPAAQRPNLPARYLQNSFNWARSPRKMAVSSLRLGSMTCALAVRRNHGVAA
jgi:hypothetical protein